MSDSHRICVICDVKERYSSEKLFFARLPLDDDRCKQWVKLIGKEDLLHLPIEKLHELRYLCGKHFEKRDFTKTKTRLKKRAVPKLHLGLPPLPDALLEGFPLHIARTIPVVVPLEAEIDLELPPTSMQTQVDIISMPSTRVQTTAPSISCQPETPPISVQSEVPKIPADNITVSTSSVTPLEMSLSTPEILSAKGVYTIVNSKFKKGRLEVCIDSLQSAINAIHGGADELEVCSSLHEGGLTPTAGLVQEIIQMVNNLSSKRPMYKTCTKCNCRNLIEDPNFRRPKLNIMLRCRGSNFCYTQEEIDTMLSDLNIFKSMEIDRFVFGALTNRQEIDLKTCKRFMEEAGSTPMTFHRAFDFCKYPFKSVEKIIELGFNRLLTSGQKATVDDAEAINLINKLHSRYGDVIQIMPGSGVNDNNVKICLDIGCKIVHSSCKSLKVLDTYDNDLGMGSSHVYVTDENIVKRLKDVIKSVDR